ncbi:MAG TPA: 6-phosphogluconolactonase [Nitriliruptorales bacterium]|nr:6-phosphogluconolactonase [Nitriliruptorales bacterium]
MTARRAALHVAQSAQHAVAERGRFTVAFSGGSTPAGMFDELVDHDLPWPRVHVLQVDERAAPDGHGDRNLTLLRQRLLDRVPVPSDNVHPMAATDDDLERAARQYADTLRTTCGDPPVLDLVHLGLGTDGHTASLILGDPVLDVDDRDVAATGPYRGWRRLTLTLPVIDRARRILWLVAGAEKAPAVRRLVDADASIPAARVSPGRAILLVDTAAAATIGATRTAPDSLHAGDRQPPGDRP